MDSQSGDEQAPLPYDSSLMPPVDPDALLMPPPPIPPFNALNQERELELQPPQPNPVPPPFGAQVAQPPFDMAQYLADFPPQLVYVRLEGYAFFPRKAIKTPVLSEAEMEREKQSLIHETNYLLHLHRKYNNGFFAKIDFLYEKIKEAHEEKARFHALLVKKAEDVKLRTDNLINEGQLWRVFRQEEWEEGEWEEFQRDMMRVPHHEIATTEEEGEKEKEDDAKKEGNKEVENKKDVFQDESNTERFNNNHMDDDDIVLFHPNQSELPINLLNQSIDHMIPYEIEETEELDDILRCEDELGDSKLTGERNEVQKEDRKLEPRQTEDIGVQTEAISHEPFWKNRLYTEYQETQLRMEKEFDKEYPNFIHHPFGPNLDDAFVLPREITDLIKFREPEDLDILIDQLDTLDERIELMLAKAHSDWEFHTKQGFRIHEDQKINKDSEEILKRTLAENEAAKEKRIADQKEKDEKPESRALHYSRECPVCREDDRPRRVALKRCGHILCYGCAENMTDVYTQEVACPTCRRESGYLELFEGGEVPKVVPRIDQETQYSDQDTMVVKEEEPDDYSYQGVSFKRPNDSTQDESSPPKRGFGLGSDFPHRKAQFPWSILQYD